LHEEIEKEQAEIAAKNALAFEEAQRKLKDLESKEIQAIGKLQTT